MILALDFGTSNLKAALINKEGKFFNYITKSVSPIITDQKCTLDANIYLDFLSDYLISIDTDQIDAIIISSNGPSFIPIYSPVTLKNNKFEFDGDETRLWMDKRGSNYSKQVSSYYGEYIDGSFFLPSILNIKQNEPSIYNKTKYFLSIDGLINYALTKKAYTVNNANKLLKYYWSKDSLAFFNLDNQKFPPFIKHGKVISTVDSDIARQFNLKKNVKVIAGGSDFYFSIIGSKVDKENIVVDINGTSEGVNLCSRTPLKDNRFLCYEHPLDGLYNISGVLSNSGIALKWLREVIGIEDLEFEQIYTLAKQAKKNSLIFLPYLNGERAPIWKPEATATLFNLTVNSRKEEIANAVIEGTIFAFKSILDIFENLGYPIDKIHVTTAKKHNDYYHQLKSDITNKEFVVYKTPSAELLGLSQLAYTSLNEFSSLKEAIESLKLEYKIYTPNKRNKNYYDKKYKLFKNLYESTNTYMMKSL